MCVARAKWTAGSRAAVPRLASSAAARPLIACARSSASAGGSGRRRTDRSPADSRAATVAALRMGRASRRASNAPTRSPARSPARSAIPMRATTFGAVTGTAGATRTMPSPPPVERASTRLRRPPTRALPPTMFRPAVIWSMTRGGSPAGSDRPLWTRNALMVWRRSWRTTTAARIGAPAPVPVGGLINEAARDDLSARPARTASLADRSASGNATAAVTRTEMSAARHVDSTARAVNVRVNRDRGRRANHGAGAAPGGHGGLGGGPSCGPGCEPGCGPGGWLATPAYPGLCPGALPGTAGTC